MMNCQLELFELKDEEKPYREERQNWHASFNVPLKELDKRFKLIMEDIRK